MKPTLRTSPKSRQDGAATLVVVMVLFLVMALLAAYANRSLMFEQRISGSYYRASMAQEMAEGGIEWTVAMLNGTAIDDSCAAVSTGGTRFVDKYLNVSAVDRATNSKLSSTTDIVADCARTSTGLVCRCPASGGRVTQPSTASTGTLIPSVGIALGTDPATPSATRYGNFQLAAKGCSDSSVDTCVTGGVQTRSAQAVAMSEQKASVGFIAAVPSSPAAPLTVKGTLTTTGAGGLGLHNNDPKSGGVLVVSGGAIAPLDDTRMDSVPGTPLSQAQLFNDSALQDLVAAGAAGDKKFFRTFMGMVPSRYKDHPAARTVTCAGGAGCETELVNAYAAGKRIVWVEGPMAISSNVVIGTVMAPMLIIVNGAVTINGPMQLNGMLVVLGQLDWTNNAAGLSQVNGMVVVQGNMNTTGRMDIVYQQSVASELRNRLGSYARISGGWIDGNTF
ncbi:Tfp pilus assembly protein PilX [Pelomonas saccharophila]|uniref:Tfp pilus assembly protein PilX n=1 Tax=Roseateles saccharophilus TaxID=304 RepID=A0ABU1YF37_ROSSA|nr:PilX N-terminal domain-containing pilus assembly protein [Roseateles saccharophilus]MDR7267475.1 Tfp pilus assembly protein PilX [Roseateles saccharophilus]